MSEKKEAEAPKKKKSKLPLIIGLVAILGGGGFFMMKGKGEKKEEPKVTLGSVEPLGEFLVNLSDGRTFLKTEISVHVAKDAHLDPSAGGGGGHGGGAAEPPAPIRDAVIAVLSSQSLVSVSSAEGKLKLKHKLAEAINHAAHSLHEAAEPEKDKDKKESKEKDGKHEEGHEKATEEIEHPDWDSQEGPVLKVYFTSFATQQ